jgi:hypothetical protein
VGCGDGLLSLRREGKEMSSVEMRRSLELRQRSVWEAADSGILLWRENLLYFIPLFAMPVWAAAFGLRLVPADLRWLSWVILWWLKPLFDRLVLHVVSARFFRKDDEGGFRSILRGLGGNLFRGLAGDLLWRRFSPLRSAVMPLRILERPKGKQYRARKTMLRQGGLSFCALLTVLGLFAEAFLLGGEFIFSLAMAEIFSPGALNSFYNYLEQAELFVYAVFCFNYILVESLYVCMGFGLYINSRVEVEGWDLELIFKNFARKLTGAAGLVIIIILFLFSTNTLNADESRDYFPDGIMSEDIVPYNSLETILDSEDFGGVKEGWAIEFKDKTEPEPLPDFHVDLDPWVERLKHIFAYVLRALIAVVIAAAIVIALIVYHRNKNRYGPRRKGRGGAFVNPLVSEEDPEILLEKAADSYARGCVVEAWACCLTGTITALSRYRNCAFPVDATEYGCLRELESRSAADAEGFSLTVKNWVLLAYGGRLPPEGSFEAALQFGRSLKAAETVHA